MTTLCFLVSGGGGNVKFIYLAQKMHLLDGVRICLVADRECEAMDFARHHNIAAHLIAYSMAEPGELHTILEQLSPDLIITTWAKIIDTETLNRYKGKMINLHYSLLPAFAGEMGTAPIENAYAQKCRFVGATCHYIDEKVDHGEIISQVIVRTDTPMDQAIEKVFKKGCLILLNSILLVTQTRLIPYYNDTDLDFSPSLTFDASCFSDDFWKALTTL